MKKLLAILSLCLLGASAQAACAISSGINWTCDSGSTFAQINSAIGSSADGAVITVANGSYTGGSLSNLTNAAKATTVQCATVRGCTVAMGGGSLWQAANWGTISKLKRISGFVFNGVSPYFIWLYGTGTSTATMTQFRFDNNTVNVASSSSDIITFGEVTGQNTTIFGVIDHNIFRTNSGNTRWIVMYDQAGAGTWPTGRMGTGNNLFIEDNQFTDQSMVNAGNAALDTDGGPHSWVVRYNTFTNTRIEHHGYYWSFPGPSSSEVYNNSFVCTSGQTDCTYSFKHQGSGEWIVFGNTATPSGGKGAPHILQNYRSFYDGANLCDGTRAEDGNTAPTTTWRGYPCNRQPGRNAARQLKPQYYWNNKWNDGSAITLDLSCPTQSGVANYCSIHIVENRDYYQGGATAQTSSTSPFNGTSGVGFGTLANRPTTCTTNSAEAGGGVGYFATDTNTLYRCSATNTWTAHYQPYTYPHPLVGGAPPETVKPNPPTNVIVTQVIH